MLFTLVRTTLAPIFAKNIGLLEGIENVPSQKGFLVATNHVDYLDGFFLGAALIGAGVRGIKMLTVTNNYWWTGSAIAIDPERKAESLNTAMTALRNNEAICVFIEGQRNHTPEILPGKTGLARLALWSQFPVIPVGLTASSGKSFVESVRLHLFQKNPYTIKIGKPLSFQDCYDKPLTHEVLVEVTNRVRRAIGPLCGKTVE